jgi:predicted metalloprotease with PDZ domain
MKPTNTGRKTSGRSGVVRSARRSLERDAEKWLRAIEQDLISRRAREIYLERGAVAGRDLDNWIQAEAEVKKSLEEVERTLCAAPKMTRQHAGGVN